MKETIFATRQSTAFTRQSTPDMADRLLDDTMSVYASHSSFSACIRSAVRDSDKIPSASHEEAE
jgi:hypothetical protein